MNPRPDLVITRRELSCAMCRRPIPVDSVTNTDPECPELVCPSFVYSGTPAGSIWWGIVGGTREVDDDGEPPQLVTLCSTECMRRLVQA